MPPRYGVAWLRLPCENSTDICCRVVSFRSTLPVTLVVVEADRQRPAEIVVLQAGAGRIGQERLEVSRDRRDAILRDDVARERIAHEPGAVGIRPGGPRIVDRHRQRAEIAVALRQRGNRRQHRRRLPAVAVPVVGHEEEHLVPADRTAERAPVFVLVVVGLGGREERLRVERLVPEVLESGAAERVRPGLDDVVGRALAVEHHRGAARLDLELIDRFDREPERQVAAFTLHDGVGDGDAFHVHVGGEVLAAHHVAPAADRLHAGHQKHERRRIARSAGVHHQRQSGVHLVPNRLAEPGVGGRQRRRRPR